MASTTYFAVPATAQGSLVNDWEKEQEACGTEQFARQTAAFYRFNGFVKEETTRWKFGDSGWHDTPIEAMTAYRQKHGYGDAS